MEEKPTTEGDMIYAPSRLSPHGRESVASLVRQLSKKEGISSPTPTQHYLSGPAVGIPLWLANMNIPLCSTTLADCLTSPPF